MHSVKHSGLFHHSRRSEAILFEQSNGKMQARRFTKEDQASQVLRVLICEKDSDDLSSKAQATFSTLSESFTAQRLIQKLQQTGIVRKFDLDIFTTIVEDRLRSISLGSKKNFSEEMNYLSYCQTPTTARPSAVKEGSDYFMSAYEEHPKKTKKSFWLSYPQGQYRTVESRDPYGGLM